MSDRFISSIEEVVALRTELEAAGKKLVLTNGAFDVLHVGHLRYLREAAALGDALVVAINSDESVRELKGPDRPVYPLEDRAEILRALEFVDRVVVFGSRRATGVIEAIQPHIYTKGGDYTPDSLIDEEKELLDRLGVEIQILSLVPGKSTSATMAKMAEEEGASRLPRLAILGSGVGSNARAILEATRDGALAADVAMVISDQPGAGILSVAEEFGVACLSLDPGTEKKGRLTDASIKELQDRLSAAGVEWVILAGFMRILREPFLSSFSDRILNLHPSLLPAYSGVDPVTRALKAGETETGCTIHLVDAGVDTGRILRQERVSIEPGETVRSLTQKIHSAEHRIFPEVIAACIEEASGSA